MSFSIHLEVGDSRWRKARGLASRLTAIVECSLRRAKAPRGGQLTILLTNDTRLKSLNRDFRGKNKPTNVLSFPAATNDEHYLGDVAIAYDVALKEARDAGKRFADHAMHLAVHGALHLLGFDHLTDAQAHAMEPLETAILAEFGIADPYAMEVA